MKSGTNRKTKGSPYQQKDGHLIKFGEFQYHEERRFFFFFSLTILTRASVELDLYNRVDIFAISIIFLFVILFTSAFWMA